MGFPECFSKARIRERVSRKPVTTRHAQNLLVIGLAASAQTGYGDRRRSTLNIASMLQVWLAVRFGAHPAAAPASIHTIILARRVARVTAWLRISTRGILPRLGIPRGSGVASRAAGLLYRKSLFRPFWKGGDGVHEVVDLVRVRILLPASSEFSLGQPSSLMAYIAKLSA